MNKFDKMIEGMDMNGFDKIAGKRIRSIKWDEDSLRFNLPDGEVVVYRAVGDCCSSSYIVDLDSPEIFKDAVLTAVEVESGEQTDIIDDDGYCNEVHKWTFYKFTTNKGMCTLSFRNESNGYYDGFLELEEDNF